jgi:hypothetical protein
VMIGHEPHALTLCRDRVAKQEADQGHVLSFEYRGDDDEGCTFR